MSNTMNKNISIESLRMLSQIFSPSIFRKIIKENNSEAYKRMLKNHYRFETNTSISNKDIIKTTYKELLKGYRCEYIYKNIIFDNIIKKFGLKDTVVYNEFNISSSKADILMLNGVIRVYEIKTELDDFTRLHSQLVNYQKIANEVYIVAEDSHCQKLICDYENTNFGIISLTSKNELRMIQEAKNNRCYFDFDTIFKVLRKDEYISLTKDIMGYIPDVPNTKIFNTCYDLLQSLDITIFQKKVLKILKERTSQSIALLRSRKTPKELRFICNSLDMNDNEYTQLYNFLNQNAYVPTLR